MTTSQGAYTVQNDAEEFVATITVLNDFGLHARPAASLAKAAQGFESEILLGDGERAADAKSILDILSLAAAQNTDLCITCRGKDAKNAGEVLLKLFESRFSLPDDQ